MTLTRRPAFTSTAFTAAAAVLAALPAAAQSPAPAPAPAPAQAAPPAFPAAVPPAWLSAPPRLGSRPAPDMLTTAELFDLDGFAAMLLDYAALTARAYVGLRYDAIDVDVLGGRSTLRGLVIDDLPDLPGCRIEAGRLAVANAGLIPLAASLSIRLEAQDLLVSGACLGPEGAVMLAPLGTDRLAIARASLSIDYDTPSGGAVVTADLDARDLGALTLEADFDYLALMTGTGMAASYEDDGGEDAPADASTPEGIVLRLAFARAEYRDAGLWPRLQPLLAPELSDLAKAGAVAEEWLRALPDGMVPPAQVEALVAQARPQIEAFVRDPGRIAVELRPEAPITWDSRQDRPTLSEAVFAARPRVLPAAAPRAALIDVALARRVLSDPAAATLEDRRTVGLALARGAGLPRDPARAAVVLGDTTADAEAALALATALAGSDPAAAYAEAQKAAAAGATGAAPLLDAIEARLGLTAALSLQSGLPATAREDLATVASLDDLAARARARLDGAGVPRSYAHAAYWASLGRAAGDAAAATILADLDARFARLRDPAPWHAVRASAEAAALDDWLAADLAARLAAPGG